MSLVDESDRLHARVRHFADAGYPDDFETLALDIAQFQAERCPGFQRLIKRCGSSLDSVDSIPAVPVAAFRLTRVAAHPPAEDAVRFLTSGTSGAARGLHAMRTTATYSALATRFGAAALTKSSPGPRVVVALAVESIDTSSLSFMIATFMQHFDGRSLDLRADKASFKVSEPGRWLLGSQGVDISRLKSAIALAYRRDEPLLVLATSFALAALLDDLGGDRLAAPRHSVVMQTGGYKGRGRLVDPVELRAGVAEAFGIPAEQVIGEYGMTELTSQLYEGTLPGGPLTGEPGIYLEPPWLRAVPVDPVTLAPMKGDGVGLARFVDLGNVDSAVAIVTQDQIRRRAGGIELLGRSPQSPTRGCSLAVEALLEQRGSS